MLEASSTGNFPSWVGKGKQGAATTDYNDPLGVPLYSTLEMQFQTCVFSTAGYGSF